MIDHETACACDEYQRLSRRSFMQWGGVAAAAAATAPAWLPRVAFAGGTPGSDFRDVIVQVYLRGGADGLSMLVPFDDPTYILPNCRPTLRVYAPDDTTQPTGRRALGLSNATLVGGSRSYTFGLHPALAPLLPAYNDGKLAFLHAAGLTNTNQSHFDAQRWMENGLANSNNIVNGWLGRHLASKPPVNPNTVLRAIGVADGLQRTLVGAPQALPIPNVQSNPGTPPALNNLAAVTSTNSGGYGLAGTSATSGARRNVLDNIYDAAQQPLATKAQDTINTIARLNQIGAAGYTPAGGAVYPANSTGYALRTTAALINANSNATDGQFVEAVAIDLGGWDTHSAQYALNVATGVFTGSMVTQMNVLAQALGAFYQDIMFTRQLRVTVIVISEFGRRIGENGTTGTDHGLGNMMMVMSPSAVGGRVRGIWNGMPSTNMTNTGVPLTTDLRHVLAEIVDKRLNNAAALSSIFPSFNPAYLNLFA